MEYHAPETNLEMAHWNENLSSSKNFAQGSTFPVVLFLFTQSIFCKKIWAHPPVIPPNSFKIFGSVALITPVSITITIFRDITVPAKRDLIKLSLIICNISSSTRFGLPFLWPMKENPFLTFFPCIYYCSFERKLCVNFWKAINCYISFVNYIIIFSILHYFQWNVFVVTFSHLLLYFLLYELSFKLEKFKIEN